MPHPYFEASTYPRHREDAKAFLRLLVELYRNPKEIRVVYEQCGTDLPPLNLAQEPECIWTEALKKLMRKGCLQELCKVVDSIHGWNPRVRLAITEIRYPPPEQMGYEGWRAYNRAREVIESCRKARWRELDLSRMGLTALPAEIGELSWLTHLDLTDNRLTSLPASLGQLAWLVRLHLSRNLLTTLPATLGQLSWLTHLDLTDNRLTSLPSSLGQLHWLAQLHLSNNLLASLPQQINQLSKLTYLNLSNNRITSLSPQLSQLSHLSELHLENNRLESLPPELGELASLTVLYLHGNPALAIPDSVLGPSGQAVREGASARIFPARANDILNYYFSQQEAREAGTLRPVRELKVMLVGRGGAGKTSLRRYFMGQQHDRNEKETPGIALDRFRLRCAKGEITVRLWDFAGQEITHALHHFFLTEGCVYLLVLDPRSEMEMQDAEYWLGLLQRYAKDSPVLVVLNKQDARQGGYDVDRAQLLEHFRSIHSFTPTNCEKREGCDELRRCLCEAVESLKNTEPPHRLTPDTWLQVMQDCDGEKGRNYLTLSEFRQVCAKHGIQESGKQEALARLLHKLGAVLHFVDEPRLRDRAVLSPHWVTDGVYRLLRYKDLPHGDGTLSLEEAVAALPIEDTHREFSARFFLHLMERFEMCFPIEDQESAGTSLHMKWLIPGALGKFQPDSLRLADWQGADCVRLRYIYDPLPEGLLPRFIVMTHVLSEGRGCMRWRYGVLLRDGPAQALVRRGQNRNCVEVTAKGPEQARLQLLQMVQGTLERIHEDLPEPKPYAEQELADLKASIYRPVTDLEAAEKLALPLAVKAEGADTAVDATTELNKLSEPAARSGERVPLRAYLSYAKRDTRLKDAFHPNLAVLLKKKLINSWDSSQVKPGELTQQEIDARLREMDVFIGLLTTEYLACDVIEQMQLGAARTRLQRRGHLRDLIFILVLMDDISLEGLDLSVYQVLKPGGLPVRKHSSLRAGFDAVQRELEKLLISRQRERQGGGL